MLKTLKGRDTALRALAQRRKHPPTHVDNAALYAGSDMYFYCKSCGWLADTKPEAYVTAVRPLCDECQAMKDLGWLE